MKANTILLFFALLMPGCGKINQSSEATPSPDSAAVLPDVTDERNDLVLSWFVDGGAEVGNSVSDVPEAARKEVRVQDPSIPPETSNPDMIYLADLTAPKADGHYAVRAVPRENYEAKRRAAEQKAEAARQAALAAQMPPTAGDELPNVVIPDGAAPVIMYSTKHCPVCVKARRWLLDQKIPYVEKDLDSDQVAAAALQQKSAAQGIPVRGVPVFEIRGHIVPGFNPAQIIAQLQQGAEPVQNI